MISHGFPSAHPSVSRELHRCGDAFMWAPETALHHPPRIVVRWQWVEATIVVAEMVERPMKKWLKCLKYSGIPLNKMNK